MEGPKPVKPKRQNRNGPVETLQVGPGRGARRLSSRATAARITDRKSSSVLITNSER